LERKKGMGGGGRSTGAASVTDAVGEVGGRRAGWQGRDKGGVREGREG